MHADEIGFAQSLFESYILDPVLLPRNATRVSQVHVLLDGVYVIVVLIGRVVAQHVHVEAGALLDHSQPNASRADDGDGFARDFVSQKWKVGMRISPLIVAREMLGRPHLARQPSEHEE